jgi:hypothetical protein
LLYALKLVIILTHIKNLNNGRVFMWRLGFVRKGSEWFVRMLNAENIDGAVAPQYSYSLTYTLGNYTYINENFLDKVTNTFYTRVLQIVGLNLLTINNPDAPNRYEFSQIIPYPVNVSSLILILPVGVATDICHDAVINWHQYNMPEQEMQPPAAQMIVLTPEQWHAANNMLAQIQHAQQNANAALGATQQMLHQAHMEIQYLRTRATEPKVATKIDTTPPVEALAPAPITLAEPAAKELVVRREEEPQQEASVPNKTKKQIKHERFLALLTEFSNEIAKIETSTITIVKILNGLNDFVMTQDAKTEFNITLQNITIHLCAKLLTTKNLARNIKELLLERLVLFSDEEYFKLNKTGTFCNIAGEAGCSEELQAKIRQQHNRHPQRRKKDHDSPQAPVIEVTTQKDDAETLAEIFAFFKGDTKGVKIDRSKLPLFADRLNEEQQTILMLAIRHGYGIETLRQVLEESGKLVLQADNANKSVFFYLAKYCKAENMAIVTEVRELFEQQATLAGLDILAEVNRQELNSGNTYMHVLLQEKSEDLALGMLEHLFDCSRRGKDYVNPFHATALIQNITQESSSVVLDSKKEEWTAVRNLIYDKLPPIILKLLNRYSTDNNPYLLVQGSFFHASTNADCIAPLVTKKDFYRLLSTLEARSKLTDKLDDQSKTLGYFSNNLNNLYEGETVFGHLSVHVCMRNSPAFEQQYIQSQFFKTNQEKLQIQDTLLWHKALLLISKESCKPREAKIIEQLMQEACVTPDSTLQFFASAIKRKHWDLVIYALTKTTEQLKIKFQESINEYFSTTHDFAALEIIHRKLEHKQAQNILNFFIFSMLQTNDLALAKTAAANCQLLFNMKCMRTAIIAAKQEPFTVLDQLFDHFEKTCDLTADPANSPTLKLFTTALCSPNLSEAKIAWLISRGHNPATPNSKGTNILHAVLKRIINDESAIPQYSLARIINIIKILFTDKVTAKALATERNLQDESRGCIAYAAHLVLVYPDEPEQMVELFKILLESGGDIEELCPLPGYTPLHYAVSKNSVELLDLIASHLDNEELKQMFEQKSTVMTKSSPNNPGYTIIELAHALTRNQPPQLKVEFFAELIAIQREIANEQESLVETASYVARSFANSFRARFGF